MFFFINWWILSWREASRTRITLLSIVRYDGWPNTKWKNMFKNDSYCAVIIMNVGHIQTWILFAFSFPHVRWIVIGIRLGIGKNRCHSTFAQLKISRVFSNARRHKHKHTHTHISFFFFIQEEAMEKVQSAYVSTEIISQMERINRQTIELCAWTICWFIDLSCAPYEICIDVETKEVQHPAFLSSWKILIWGHARASLKHTPNIS